jgi:hypothetical protein
MDDRDYDVVRDAIDELDNTDNVPWMYRWSRVSHYYGDTVRQIFIAAAALMLLAAPFYTDDLAIELPFIVIGTVVLVCVAALTSPRKRAAISADAIAAGVGLVIFEMWALLGYDNGTLLQFALREALAILFLFALYFSTKTLRSMLLDQVGRRDTPSDFSPRPRHPRTPRERAQQEAELEAESREILHEVNEHQKFDYTD